MWLYITVDRLSRTRKPFIFRVCWWQGHRMGFRCTVATRGWTSSRFRRSRYVSCSSWHRMPSRKVQSDYYAGRYSEQKVQAWLSQNGAHLKHIRELRLKTQESLSLSDRNGKIRVGRFLRTREQCAWNLTELHTSITNTSASSGVG